MLNGPADPNVVLKLAWKVTTGRPFTFTMTWTTGAVPIVVLVVVLVKVTVPVGATPDKLPRPDGTLITAVRVSVWPVPTVDGAKLSTVVVSCLLMVTDWAAEVLTL